jgi:hypothetical protein
MGIGDKDVGALSGGAKVVIMLGKSPVAIHGIPMKYYSIAEQ